MVLFVFRLCSPNWLNEPCCWAAVTHLFGYRPCCRRVIKPTGSRLNQHEVCLSCRGGHRCPSPDLSMSKQVTLSSSRNLDHARTVDQTASLALQCNWCRKRHCSPRMTVRRRVQAVSIHKLMCTQAHNQHVCIPNQIPRERIAAGGLRLNQPIGRRRKPSLCAGVQYL